MRLPSISSVIVALLATPALSVRTWASNGSVNPWDQVYTEHDGTVDEVTNVYYVTPPALKMTQTYDANYNGLYHAEVFHYDGYQRGQTKFYGFAFRLQQDWQFSPAQGYNLAQFIADFTDLPCEETYMPSTMIWIHGNQLQARVKHGSVCPVSAQVPVGFGNLATVTAGVWHRIVLEVAWRSDAPGVFNMWYDDVSVVSRSDLRTTVNDGRQFQFRVGLYANSWNSGYQGTQPFRQVWFDRIATGTTYADVDPAQW
jgi:hypothetical protein